MKICRFLTVGWTLSILFLAMAPAALLANGKSTPALPTGPKIRVLLEKEAASAFLEVKGKYRVIRKDDGHSLSSGKVGKRFVVHAIQDGLRWGEEYPDVYQISIIPLSSDTCFLVNGIQYKGAISIYHVHQNHIAIVNEVSIEEFIKSTLAIEYDDRLPSQAMEALAIAARTEAYYKTLQGQLLTRPWDIVANDVNYYGVGMGQKKSRFDQAVDETRYMVLESTKKAGPLAHATLESNKIKELATKGLNAQKILKAHFPQAKIGATIHADELAIR